MDTLNNSDNAQQILAVLGRQPELSLAELEQVFGSTTQLSEFAALVETSDFSVERLGGTQKAGVLELSLNTNNWKAASQRIVSHYAKKLLPTSGKVTIGISVYGSNVSPREVQKCGLMLKQALKQRDGSVRLVPNETSALSTATSHHNKLGLSANKREIIVVFTRNKVFVADSIGSQNITALAARDQGRPKRDAFVGMLPPKLALMMVNMSGYKSTEPASSVILDPFCGTGVILQEAALLGYSVYGTDLADKMVDYARINLDWLKQKHQLANVNIEHGDAIEYEWQPPNNAVVAETYLGQPFSAPPAADKLQKVVGICDDIISKFLINLATQIDSDTPLALAVPSWRDEQGHFTHLTLITKLEKLGYRFQSLKSVDVTDLIYYREDQVVARQLLLLTKS